MQKNIKSLNSDCSQFTLLIEITPFDSTSLGIKLATNATNAI